MLSGLGQVDVPKKVSNGVSKLLGSRQYNCMRPPWGAGWPRVVTFPGLPQIRTCVISASGSSDSWVHYVEGNDRVNSVSWRQWVPLVKEAPPIPALGKRGA